MRKLITGLLLVVIVFFFAEISISSDEEPIIGWYGKPVPGRVTKSKPGENLSLQGTKDSGKKFGLSLEKRQQIFREVYRSQDKTLRMAKKKYPNDAIKKWDYARELDKEYEKLICDKYGITEHQKSSILAEGLMKNWPHRW